MSALRDLSFAERRDWLRLIRTPTVGPVSFRDLIQRFGSAGDAIDALPGLIRRKPVSVPPPEQIEAEMERSEELGIRLLAACEPDYPSYLRAVDPPPPMISVWGKTDILQKPCVAIVGSRNASAVGQQFAQKIAGELGEEGFTIVSGLARGIDRAAHYGSIATGTAAVLGGGVDHVYPRQNSELYEDIRQGGALISESPLCYRATARDFPRRNRIISGLSLGVIVVEAAERSGTLITARYALEQNREVMAVPGSPLDPRTQGCNRLIQQGAALVGSADDVINILQQVTPPSVMEPEDIYRQASFDWKAAEDDIAKAHNTLTGLLSPTPVSRDVLIRLSGLPAPIAIAALLEMELSGQSLVEADGRISLNILGP